MHSWSYTSLLISPCEPIKILQLECHRGRSCKPMICRHTLVHWCEYLGLYWDQDMSVAIASDVSNSCCHSLHTKQLHQAHKEPDDSADVYADCPSKVLLVSHSLTSQHVCISQTKVEPHIGIIVYTLISAMTEMLIGLYCSVFCRQIVFPALQPNVHRSC